MTLDLNNSIVMEITKNTEFNTVINLALSYSKFVKPFCAFILHKNDDVIAMKAEPTLYRNHRQDPKA